MRVHPRYIALLVGACFVLAFYSTQVSAANRRSADKPSGDIAVVTMNGDDLTFDPPTITVKRGQTVQWENLSHQEHTVTFDPAKAVNKADVELPNGASPFESGYMSTGQNFSHRFTVPGTYHYVCILHEVQGMKGEVVVK